MIEKPELLEDDSDTPPDQRHRPPADSCRILAEQTQKAAGGSERKEEQPQERALAGAGGAAEETELAFIEMEGHVLEHFRPIAVTQSDIFEADHLGSLRSAAYQHRCLLTSH
jgi:hypothetical protein